MLSAQIEVVKEDITRLEADAIVNAANPSLMGGGGVDGAIHRAGGPAILEQCKAIVERQGRCAPGRAVITTAGKMPSKYVIHTVGPVWRGGVCREERLLADAYRNSLQLASDYHLQSVAFPNISTGIYGFPKDKAAEIAVRTVREFLKADGKIMKVVFACYDEENYSLYQNLLEKS
jgi:O-acetyl-ADP-ribose deacetylase (regulator of RNase III)